jgi:ferric-dicitrate binding protein FerR (iron transport regulator)
MSGQDNKSPFDKSGKRPLPEEKLLAYLEGRLSPEEQHEVEEWLAEEGMESDALEGLSQLPPADARESVTRLNYKLRKETAGKKRSRRVMKTDQFTWIAICIILFVVIVGYIIIKMKLSR